MDIGPCNKFNTQREKVFLDKISPCYVFWFRSTFTGQVIGIVRISVLILDVKYNPLIHGTPEKIGIISELIPL